MEPVSLQSAAADSEERISQSSSMAGGLSPSGYSLSARPPGRKQRSSRFTKWLLRRLLAAVGNPPITVVLWTGEEIAAGPPTSDAPVRIRIRDARTLRRILLDPFFQFPEAYSDGRAEVDGDLEELMSLVAHCSAEASRSTYWLTMLEKALHWGSRSTRAASQRNIHHHYDIGNDFYRLWLDENLLYTCAYFEDSAVSLEQAQVAKMDHVCRKLQLQPGESVIEAGCGWGGFALHMARKYGCRVRAYNISKEQIAYARQWCRREGLEDRVEFVLDDWRNISGSCDVFVSVGMLEHVGTTNYRRLGEVIHRCLSPNGRGLIHSIGRNRKLPFDPWIERRIFPGAYPPTLWQMGPIFEPRDFSVLEVENLRMHYAETLRHWLARYEQSVDVVGRMYDARFVRMWRVYLAGSIAAFTSGSLQLFQVLFARPRRNELPLSRAHQYRHLWEPVGANGHPARPEHWGDRQARDDPERWNNR